MKKIILSVIIAAFVFGLFYLIGSFVNISFNLSNWSEFSLAQVGIWGGFFGFCSGFFYLNHS